MAEWGNPAVSDELSLPVKGERTWGTETSQYPEEEKSNEMPEVAASETGTSPNRGSLWRRGCRTHRRAVRATAEVPWNGAPETVTARYAKSKDSVVEFLSNARLRGIGRETGGTTLQG